MRTDRSHFTDRFLILALILLPHTVSAQTSRGSTGAVALLGRVSGSLASAASLEYISTVHSLDAMGRPVTLYVHAELRRPTSVHVTVSTTQVDAPDAVLIVGDGGTITGYDPKLKTVTHRATDGGGPNLVLPPGFGAAEPAFPTVRQFFGGAPFDSLFVGDARSPITLDRHTADLPGTLLINAHWSTEMVGDERTAKLYVDPATTTPRRLQLGSVENGVESVQYIEDFGVFTVNASFPDDTFHWTPPASLQASAPPAAAPKKPAAKPTKKTAKHLHSS